MKRWTLRVGVFLLLGAIVNVVVAWGHAVAVHLTEAPRVLTIVGDGNTGWQGVAHRRLGGYFFSSMWLTTSQSFASGPPKSEILPEWSPVGQSQTRPTDEAASNIIDARGWPMLTLLSWIERDDHRVAWLRRAGIHLSFWPWRNAQGPASYRQLPTQPIWPGFAINTVFYAGILWLLFAAPFALRRRIRIKRGLCPKCAYDLRKRPGDSSLCPECGTPMTPRRGAGM